MVGPIWPQGLERCCLGALGGTLVRKPAGL